MKIDFELLIQEKKASVDSDTLPALMANRLQMRQLFSNLVGNALKFSERHPVISVHYNQVAGNGITGVETIDSNARYHYLHFSDNGIGFHQQNAGQIFMLFTRLHNRNEYTGTGIGLALCKKIVENHHGIIHATSQPGHGSTFHVYLPVLDGN